MADPGLFGTMTMSRDAAIAQAQRYLDNGAFKVDLARRVSVPTESQNPDRAPELLHYLEEEMRPTFEDMGFQCTLLQEPTRARTPFLYAERIESPELVTVLGYGHGDVIRGLEKGWDEGLTPWTLTERDGRWYGRGVADNKGQHSINLAATAAVLETRRRLGFNAKWLIEMGEEVVSPGLAEIFQANKDLLAADVLIASDGPRLARDRPTIFLGARGSISFDLWVEARGGAQHSGNWGGLLSNPAIQLAHAIAVVVGPKGEIRIPEWVPDGIPESVRRALANCELRSEATEPTIDATWGEPGLSGPEKVFGWCSFEVLAFESGTPATPVNAIPARAWARCQLRFVVGVQPDRILTALRRHLDRQGLGVIQIAPVRDGIFRATRLDLENPWVKWTVQSITETTGSRPAILPNLGGSLPNDVFAEVLGVPTIWIPHSYPGCSQHAPNEHLPISIAREGLAIMTGLYWDLGERQIPPSVHER